MAGIVLDALTEADLVKHFEVEAGALLDAQRLYQATFAVQNGDPFSQFVLDLLDRSQDRLCLLYTSRCV